MPIGTVWTHQLQAPVSVASIMDPLSVVFSGETYTEYLHFIKIYKVVKWLLCQILVISPLRPLLMCCNANCWHKPKGKHAMKCVSSVIQSPAAQKN